MAGATTNFCHHRAPCVRSIPSHVSASIGIGCLRGYSTCQFHVRHGCVIIIFTYARDSDDGLWSPTYRCVHRRTWLGTKHSQLYGQLRALALAWRNVAPSRLIDLCFLRRR